MAKFLSTECIAERELMYSLRDDHERKQFTVRVFAPFAVEPGTVNFEICNGVAGCKYELDGLPEKITDTCYGADSIQALQLATNVDGILRMWAKKYNFYFPTGEGYFED
jgi:hypothetical protein